MMSAQDRFRQLDGCIVLYPGNYINDLEGEKLEDLCLSFLDRGFRRFVVDFSGTDLINSIGVSILIGIIEKIRETDGGVRFSGLKGVNRDIFDIVGLTGRISVFTTEKDALDWCAGAAGGIKGMDLA
jgi:anti-anti-sigma regulatory factor